MLGANSDPVRRCRMEQRRRCGRKTAGKDVRMKTTMLIEPITVTVPMVVMVALLVSLLATLF